jgi:hypothetical protein
MAMARSVRTIPIASASSGHEFSIADKDWLEIERSYRCNLSPDARKSILEATTSFVYFESFERTAKPHRLAIERVDAIEGALENLFLTLHAPANEATVYADHFVKRHFHYPFLELNNEDLFSALSRLLGSLKDACRRAAQEMDDPNQPSHREGECWDQWIRRLTEIVKENGLPSGASKGGHGRNNQSPFTWLVMALQKCVPTDARRHDRRAGTLAAAIARARHGGTKMTRAPRKNVPAKVVRGK